MDETSATEDRGAEQPVTGEPAAAVPDAAEARVEKPQKRKAPKQAAVAAPTLAAGDPEAPPEVSVIVPIISGDGRVNDVFEALSAELVRLGRRGEFLFVFDGVRGAAWDQASRLATLHPERVRAIALQQVFGESACLQAGFERARGGIIVTSPQYVQVDPFELGRLLQAIDAGADFVTPWRHPRIDPVLNRVQSSFFNWIMRRIMHAQFHDLNCYFRAMKRKVLEEVAVYGDMYRFLPAIAARQGFEVVELKVRHLTEWGGRGIFGLGVYVRRLLDIVGVFFLSKFTLKPLRFFGSVGGVFLLAGGLVCTTVFVQRLFFDEGPVFSRPIFLLGFLLVVLGVQVIGFGLVGEIIIFTQARNLRAYSIEQIHESRAKPPSAAPTDDAGGKP